MIPADSFLLDGDTALWVVPDADHLPQHWERSCDHCQPTTSRTYPRYHPEFCPDCDGTGRHTFDIEAWLCDVYDCAKCIGGVHKRQDTFRVHVIDVLPIVENAAWDGRTLPMICRSTHDRDYFLRSAPLLGGYHEVTDVTLPPAAAPGMWLVRLAVHS